MDKKDNYEKKIKWINMSTNAIVLSPGFKGWVFTQKRNAKIFRFNLKLAIVCSVFITHKLNVSK